MLKDYNNLIRKKRWTEWLMESFVKQSSIMNT